MRTDHRLNDADSDDGESDNPFLHASRGQCDAYVPEMEANERRGMCVQMQFPLLWRISIDLRT
jgi:hypothetical protein